MYLFGVVLKYAAMVGIRPLRPGHKNPFNRRNISVLLIYSLFFISATAFLVFDANSFDEYAEAFYPWMTLSFIYVGFSMNVSLADDFFRLKEQCEQFIESEFHDDPISKRIFERTNGQIGKWTRIAFVSFLKVFPILTTVPIILWSYYRYFAMNLGGDAFFIYSYMKLPFDPQTPIGYAINISLQVISFGLICHVVVCGLGLLLGFFGVIMTFGHSIQKKFHDLNVNYSKKTDRNNTTITNSLRDAVHFHSTIKDLASDFSSLFQYTISLFYIWSILAICDTLLICQNVKNVGDLLFPLVLLYCAVVLIFIFCELGERITDRFHQIDIEIMDSNWYKFPIDIQKKLPIVMNGTQNPMVLSGIGNISCTREAFKNVTTTGYSYCAMLQRV